MTLVQIRDAICHHCNLTSPEALARVEERINQRYRRITASLGLDTSRFVTKSVSASVGVRTVTFTGIEKIDRLIDATTSTIVLVREISMHEMRTTQAGTSAPLRWALQSTGADSVVVLLDTLPQVAYDLQADGWVTLADLEDDDEPAFPESYHDILVFDGISEELLKKEKDKLALVYSTKANNLLADLRFFLADSHTRDTQQANGRVLPTTGTAGGSASGSSGGTAYTQTALLTFNRGASTAPFAVEPSSALYVANLGAEFIGNVTSDRLIGRDTLGAGESEQLTVSNGLEFSGAGGIQRSALSGDVTASAGSNATTIAAGAVTDAKVSASAAIAWTKLSKTGSSLADLTTRSAADLTGTLADARLSLAPICTGRLTLETGVPVSTTDQSAKTTIYFTPYGGGLVSTYSGSAWTVSTFTEKSLSLAGLTASTPYDIFIVDSTLTLEALAWSSATARATGLTTQNGVLVKSGATTRRYLGTVYINASGGQTDDSLAKRYVWNYYNRVERPLQRIETSASWTYNSGTIRQANGSTANQLDVVIGVGEDAMRVSLVTNASVGTVNDYAVVGVGLDSTTTFYVGQTQGNPRQDTVNIERTQHASASLYPGIGRHIIAWLENRIGTGTVTFTSASSVAQSGLTGTIRA